MVKDVLDKAIKTDGIVEMEYSKDGLSSKFYQLCKVGYSLDFGDNCFCGCPIGSEKELTFRIDKVKDIQLTWDFIFEENIQFVKCGIYVLSFMGDNYLEFGLYNYDVGEKLLDHFHFDLWTIQAYHYIPYYSEVNKNHWFSFNKSDRAKQDSFYIFAYTMEPGISVELEDRFDFLLTGDDFKTTEHLGIYYTSILVQKGNSFDKIEINKGINILAYSICPEYSYDYLRVHNDIMWELYHKK